MYKIVIRYNVEYKFVVYSQKNHGSHFDVVLLKILLFIALGEGDKLCVFQKVINNKSKLNIIQPIVVIISKGSQTPWYSPLPRP